MKWSQTLAVFHDISTRAKVIQNFGLPWMVWISTILKFLSALILISVIIIFQQISVYHSFFIIFIFTKVFLRSAFSPSSSFTHILSSSSCHMFLKSSSFSFSNHQISYRRCWKQDQQINTWRLIKRSLTKLLTIRVADVGLGTIRPWLIISILSIWTK